MEKDKDIVNANLTQKIFIGYRLKPVGYLDELIGGFTEPLPNSEEAASEEAVKAKKAWEKQVDKIRTAAKDGENVYLSTFDEVHILIPSLKKAVTYKSPGRDPGAGGKPPISLAVRSYLLNLFPNAWGRDTNGQSGNRTYLSLKQLEDAKKKATEEREPILELATTYAKPQAIFMGFEPRMFLKILGLECGMPLFGQPLPAAMWFGNSDHRDITEAIKPKTESKLVDWDMVIRAHRMGLSGDALAQYDAIFKGWPGPGVNPEQDATIAMLFATHLGFI